MEVAEVAEVEVEKEEESESEEKVVAEVALGKEVASEVAEAEMEERWRRSRCMETMELETMVLPRRPGDPSHQSPVVVVPSLL